MVAEKSDDFRPRSALAFLAHLIEPLLAHMRPDGLAKLFPRGGAAIAAQPEKTHLTYTMALANGRWLIDDVAGRGGVGDWLWSRLLQSR